MTTAFAPRSIRRQIGLALGAFALLSLVVGIGWLQVAGPITRVLARPVSHLVGATVEDVVWIDRHREGGPVLVLAGERRTSMAVVLEKSAGLDYVVLISLLVAGTLLGPVRRRMAGWSGAARVGGVIVGMVAWHVLLSVLLVAYVAAAGSRPEIPRGVRMLTAFTDAAHIFIPFLLCGLAFWRWPARGRPALGTPDPSVPDSPLTGG